MKKLLALLLTAMAMFAVPAAASAEDHFLDDGAPIGSNEVTAEFTGSAGFVLNAQQSTGVHCTHVNIVADFATTEGSIGPVNSAFDGCTTTSANPEQNNLTTDTTLVATGSPALTADVSNSKITISNVHINNKVTHPVTKHLIVVESTLECSDLNLHIPEGQASAIETGTLTGDCTVQSGIPPSGTKHPATVTGHFTSDGTIGIESMSEGKFLHEGVPVGEGLETSFSGSAGFTFFEASAGVHCGTIHIPLQVTTLNAHIAFGTVTFLNCTTTSPNPAQDGLPTDATQVGTWTVTPKSPNKLTIDNVHINNKVTHPVTTHLVLSESTLKGYVTGEVDGSTEAIETVTLGDEGATVQFGIPPSGAESSVNVAGTLTADGTIGIE